MTYPETETFWMDPSGLAARGFRRYVGCSGQDRCADGTYHNALLWLDQVSTKIKLDLDGTIIRQDVAHLDPHDERWPTHCDACGFEFSDIDPKQTFDMEIYRRKDDGRKYVLSGLHLGDTPPDVEAAPGGAMYDAYWMPNAWKGSDGISLSVVLPNEHVWSVDSQASNCDQKDRPHKCWIRHGDPRTGRVTVDKNGDTCGAGGGSILVADYHGFLQEGHLTAG